MARAALAAASTLLLAALAGCVLQAGGPGRTGDLVRIVDFVPTSEAFDDANDPTDILAALADTRFVYTHDGDAVDAGDVTVEYTDESGRERSTPLSTFTSQPEVGRGDRVTITGALLTSPVTIRNGGDTLASRGGPTQDWLQAGGYPLPLALGGGLAVWDLDGGAELDAGLGLFEVKEDRESYACGEDGCEPTTYQSTLRFSDGSMDGDAKLGGELRLEGVRGDLELALDGTLTAGVLANLHVFEQSTDPDDEGTDADFGFDLDASAEGDGLVRLRVDDGAIAAAGREGRLSVSGTLATWDDEHPRSEAYSPANLDDFDFDVPYEEDDLPFPDNPSQPIAQALADLWRMDLAPGDEFRLATEDSDDVPRFTLTVRVVDEVEKKVAAGTFDALQVESTAAVAFPYEGGSESFDLPMLTTWIDTRSGLPVAFEETFAYDYDGQDFKPLLAFFEDDDAQVTGPEDLHVRLEGHPTAELAEFEKGLHVAPMASLLLPLASMGAPVLFPGFGPFGGMLYGPDDYASPETPEAPPYAPPPRVAFHADGTGPGGRVTVVMAESGLPWSDLVFDGGGCLPPFEGDVQAGDVVVCSMDGRLVVSHWPTNTVLFATAL